MHFIVVVIYLSVTLVVHYDSISSFVCYPESLGSYKPKLYFISNFRITTGAIIFETLHLQLKYMAYTDTYQKPIRDETCNARSQLPNIQCELIG